MIKDYFTIKKSGLFDSRYYLSNNPDIRRADIDPLRHYVLFGVSEGRNPSAEFDSKYYLSTYSDVRTTNVNPLVHYIKYGKSENRKIKAPKINNSINEYYSERMIQIRRDYWDKYDENNFFDCLAKMKVNKNYFNVKNYPLVTIIMPTFNRAAIISHSINSVLNQSYSAFELIIIDDGSTDETDKVIMNYKDPRLKYKKNDKNLGVSAARNIGLNEATGDYIFFLDSDNRWKNNFLQTMIDYMIVKNLDAAYSGIAITEDFKKYYAFIGVEYDYTSLLKENYIDLNCFGFKKTSKKVLFDVYLRRLGDWDFILSTVYFQRVGYAPFIGVEYYEGENLKRITTSVSINQNNFSIISYIQRKNEFKENYKNSNHSNKKIAIVFHIYYLNQVPFILNYLKSVDFSYDLYVTTSHSKALIDQLFISFNIFPRILIFNNVGRDVGPFIYLLSTLVAYDGVLKLHTKRDLVQELGGSLWRNHQLNTIFFENNNDLNRFIKEFFDNDDILAAGTKEFYLNDTNRYALLNSKVTDLIYKYYGTFVQDWGFFAGTSFWFKPIIYSRIQGLHKLIKFKELIGINFENEHVLERLLGGILNNYKPNQKLILSELSDRSQNDQFVFKYFITDNFKGNTEGINSELKRLKHIYSSIELFTETNFKTSIIKDEYPNLQLKRFPKEQKKIHFRIKIGVPSYEVCEQWGDWHFASSLRVALIKAGYDASVDILPEWYEYTGDEYTVNLVLRGLSKFRPNPKNLNIIWMISHPDMISDNELIGYDHIFVASDYYYKKLQAIDANISVLLQCTDTSLFNLNHTKLDHIDDLIFVGNSRGILRKIVSDSLKCGFRLSIYGGGWEGLVGDKFIKSKYISNRALSQYYFSAKIVLNDHWEDMKKNGFVSNRIYDVIASGGIIISDKVLGADSFFKKYVYTYESLSDLRDTVNRLSSDPSFFYDKEDAFNEIQNKYSFDSRAATIISLARNILKKK